MTEIIGGSAQSNTPLLAGPMDDRPAVRSLVHSQFGEEVARGVDALTKDDRLPKSERMLDSLLRIRQQPRAVWLVKLADRITNLEPSPSSWTKERRIAYASEASMILQMLGGASDRLRERFARKLADYAGYAEQN